MTEVSHYGGWNRWALREMSGAEFQSFLHSLTEEAQENLRRAISDTSGSRHCAYDKFSHRAYCFQRQGLSLYYQYWHNVPSHDVASKLFRSFPTGEIPFPESAANRIYYEALSG